MERIMKLSIRHVVLGVVAAVTITGAAASAQADTWWGHNHPRRDEILDRVDHQLLRIKELVATGQLSPMRADFLRGQDFRVRNEEQAAAAANGGFITPWQQARFNEQLNRVSAEIGL
jgi:hypothetical protein